MHVAIIDADLIGRKKHRFPNLACMKLSSYYRSLGHTTILHTTYDGLEDFDLVCISKVFTDTEVPGEPEDKSKKCAESIAEWYAENDFLKQPNITYGGTGFFYDKAPPLAPEIEHCMPDYHLYDEWVAERLRKGDSPDALKYYTDYSIGYLTRGCFRHCSNCVNRNADAVLSASPLDEFYDPSRGKICLLDDNFFGCGRWRELIRPVLQTGKRFRFKQGLDLRLLTEDTVREMVGWKYDKEYIFAFDFLRDKPLIVRKLQLLHNTMPDKKWELKFYVFCGYDEEGRYAPTFWKADVGSIFERVMTLASYGAKPYLMRYETVYDTEFAPLYAALAAWCNQPGLWKTFSFRKFSECYGMSKNGYRRYKRDTDRYLLSGGKKGASWRAMERAAEAWPEIADRYFDVTPKEIWRKECKG